MCEHISKLGSHYPGRFCIYCGDEIAEIDAEGGQIILKSKSENRRKYIAVIFNDRQVRVKSINLGGNDSDIEIEFEEEEGKTKRPGRDLILAFQNSEEVLRI
ncbi:MAG: hypothetical protein D6723_16730 [Acidobacteria bacterium]|nr:MAG: hypothetical protein D6723_16730 [Acidobacteriota bacterium]